MINIRRRFLKPAAAAGVSFFCLLLTLLLTNPLKNLGYIIILFGSLFMLLISLGFLLAYIKSSTVSMKSRYRIVIFSFLFITILMFRSAQSLNFSDLLILILICFGLIFYSAKRTL
jgi:hypothetical protein